MRCSKGDLVKLTQFWCTILYKDITHEFGIVIATELAKNDERLVKILFGDRVYWFPEYAIEKVDE